MTETIILDFEIDQSQAITQLKETERSIISLKNEQKELNKAYKEGAVSEEEYIEENIRLQQQVKKETDQKRTLIRTLDAEKGSRDEMRVRVAQLTREYNSLNIKTEEGRKRADALAKEIKDLNQEINKGSKEAGNFKDNIGNYTESIEEAVGGTNVLGTSFASLANPLTAVTGLVAGLVTAYATSTSGARDLAFAQNILSTSTQLLRDEFAELISDTKEGEGIFAQFASGLVAYLGGFDTAALARFTAQQKVLLADLKISEAFAQGAAKESERRAEIQRRIRDDEQKSLEERLEASRLIDAELESSANRTITVIQAQIDAIKRGTLNYDLNREAQLEVAQLTAEIADKQEEITGKLTENVTARRTILELTRQQAELEAQNQRAIERQGEGVAGTDTAALENEVNTRLQIIQTGADAELSIAERLTGDIAKVNKQLAREQAATDQQRTQFAIAADERRLNSFQDSIANVGSLFEEESEAYQALALSQNFIDTYRAATAALAPPPVGAGPLFGPLLAGATIAAGFGNAARIAGFDEGGQTGPGFGQEDHSGFKPAGIVHEHEYVVPKFVNTSPEAQPHISALEGMRLRGYADGGLVSSSISQPVNQEFTLANALKNLPPAELSVKEVTSVQNRIRMRERSAKL